MTDETIKTKIWMEEPEEDNPFAASACFCSGYDVFGDLLGKISWPQYLYLLFRLELPSREQEKLLETLAVALAHPGIRDHSVRAAMNAGVGGSTRASALMAALAVGAGNLGGGREVYQATGLWQQLGTDLDGWRAYIAEPPEEQRPDVWLPMEHTPGFDPNGASCPRPIRQALAALASRSPGKVLPWLEKNRTSLEETAGYPIAMSGVAAAACIDLGLSPEQSEMLFLLLRLPGAAVQSLEQEGYGWRQYPFFGQVLKPMADKDYKTHMASLETKS